MQNIEQIYKENFKIVYKYLFCLTHNEDVAEELTQETFYRAVMNINSFRKECKISVWLCKIAKNLWYNETLYRTRNKELDNETLEIEALEGVEDIILKKNEKKEMYRRIKKLDEKTRKVIYLRIIWNLSFKEIATILNQTENWTRVVFYRGKQKLKEAD